MADDLAWDLFFEALDPESDVAARIPPGAAIIAADSPDRDFLIGRYHADRRSVVLVHAEGRAEIRRPDRLDRMFGFGGALLGALWLVLRSVSRTPA
jgi:hypothetical protein